VLGVKENYEGNAKKIKVAEIIFKKF